MEYLDDLNHNKVWHIGSELAIIDIHSKSDLCRSKFSNIHSVVFIFQGSLSIEINGEIKSFQTNQVINIMPIFDYTFMDASTDITAIQILYTDIYIKDVFKKGPPFPMEYMARLMVQPELSLSEEQMNMFGHHFNGLKLILQNKQHHFYQEKVKCAIWMLMMDLGNITYHLFEQHSIEEESDTKKILFYRFIAMLSKYICKERTATFYAGQLCVTPQYLERIVKALTKRSVKEWIQNTLISQINEQLLSSNDNIQRLASDFGFVDQPTFTKYYRRYMKITPMEYRKKAMI